jgi:2-polyprenyl-6-methoxyphenol hydroxylase-like FAD-dependent oxidoreductase
MQSNRRAIVCGSGLAGLLAARVLSPHYDEVIILERDLCTGSMGARKGVPQGRHVHGLLPRGSAVIERLFPGLLGDLEADGATTGDLGADTLWFHFGGYKDRSRIGLVGHLQSRPLLEGHIRRRCLAQPNIRIREGWEVTGPLVDASRSAVIGVTARAMQGDVPDRIEGDLVVDATGRGSQAGRWIEELGHAQPRETSVRVDLGYTTRLYRRRPYDLGGAKVCLIYPTPPDDRRLAAALPIEGDRWIVTLAGWLGDHAPADEEGFLAFARSLAAPDIHDLVRTAEPVSGFMTYKFASSLRRHYEALDRLPRGFLVLGDALCSFNPVYGQGMTLAALEAEALECVLEEETSRRDWTNLPRAFYQRSARPIDAAWSLAAGEDFRHPGVAGRRPSGYAAMSWYVGRVHEAVTADPEVQRVFYGVMDMTSSPAALLRPGIARRVLQHWLGTRRLIAFGRTAHSGT